MNSLYQAMSGMSAFVNEEPYIATFINLLVSIRADGHINGTQYDSVMNRLDENAQWTNKNYPGILEYFGLQEITTLDPPTTGMLLS